jgi:hypothetical protein
VSGRAPETAERVRALMTLYLGTHYDVEMPGGAIATIRVGAPAPAPVQRWIGDDDVAFYATACNPRSTPLPLDQNLRRLETLRAELRTRGCRWLEGVGHVPGATWREPSLLIAGIGDAGIAEVVRCHDQNSVIVVPATSIATLRVYRPEWRAFAGERADVEWA